MTRGFVLGKFLPPHSGHQLLCETAQALVDDLTILVCWLPDDPISGPLRLAWMRELFPNARVIGHGDVVPQTPDDHPDFWAIWREIVRSAHPEPIDWVFASEDYGERLAVEVGARFHPIDPLREGAPISGSAIRSDPSAAWSHLPPPVRAFYTRTICLHGPESSGKSTMAAALARHFDADPVPEYGRTWCKVFGNDVSMSDLVTIARTQDALAASHRRRGGCRQIVDTDPLMTCVWARMMHGYADPWFDDWHATADLYLLLDIDLPWIDDGTRMYGGESDRRRFFDLCQAELERRNLRWTLISGLGEARFGAALAAISSAGL